MNILNSRLPGYKYQGDFEIDGITYSGGMVADGEHGSITLIVSKMLDGEEAKGYSQKNYRRIPMIHGVVNGGKNVTLFKCRCKENDYTEYAEDKKHQRLIFSAEYIVISGRNDIHTTYNRFQFTIENGMAWSQISQILVIDNPHGGEPNQVRFRGNSYSKWFIMGGSQIFFRSQLNNRELMNENRRESFTLQERLQITITPKEPCSISYFLSMRDQLVDMISFAIKDNVNILSQYLICGPEDPRYAEQHLVVTNKKTLPINHTPPEEYNFKLDQLPRTKDAARAVNRLEPILRLYASFYRYDDMPLEMVFLNATQALETLHGRFYHVPYSKQNLPDDIAPAYKKITLSERITALLEKSEDKIFAPLFNQELRFVERVVIARNYYTHYHESQWQSALDSECLYDVVRILKCILEYFICVQLGVDISSRVQEEINKICIGIDGQVINIFDV